MLDLFFDPEYAKLYERIDGPSKTFRLDCEYGSVQNTYILRKIEWCINKCTYYDIVTPYGYGGPIVIESIDMDQLLESYKTAFMKHCMECNIVCEFIRFHLFDNVDVRERYYGDTMKLLDDVIVDTSMKYDDIYMMYNRKVRKNIRRAISNGLEILVESNLNHIEEFIRIYYSTMERNNASRYYFFEKEYFENITKRIPENFIYFYVFKDGQIISTELVLFSEKYAYSFLGGTDVEYYAYRPNDFLKDAIIKWCNKTGREMFVLGGGHQENDGIYEYKRTFTTVPDVPFYIGKNIFNPQVYEQLIEMRAKEDPCFDMDASYFPLYRA